MEENIRKFMYIYIDMGFLGGLAVKKLPAMWDTWVHPWVGKIPWRRT